MFLCLQTGKFFVSFTYFAVLGIEPRASHTLSKYCATKVYAQRSFLLID